MGAEGQDSKAPKTAKQLEKEKKKAEEKAAKLEKLRLKQEKQKQLDAKVIIIIIKGN